MEYLTIERTFQGFKIADTISQKRILYIGHSLNSAIQQHRKQNGLRGRHLTQIYLD